MESLSLPNWQAFIAELQKIRDVLTQNTSGKPPDLLFRGQSDSSWPLTTTLERAGCEGMSFDEYYRLTVHRVRPTVEALTGSTWDVPDYDVLMEQAFRGDRELFSLRRFPSVSFYRYMVYLRHHGFPSPLLDWTSSIHIAAFFTFRETSNAKTRSIYVYCETPHGMKGGAVGEPAMRAIGRYVRTHARHFRQQSDYTICAAFDESAGWRFHPHDKVFWSRGKQDYVWKFDLPSTERIAILKSLDQYNLNAFSLFDSEEALLETMWLREQISEGGAPQMKPSEVRLPFTSRKLAEILKEHGYETHPKGMVQPLGVEIERTSEGKTAYFDVNADAVRKNGEVPERPIRLTFERAAGPSDSAPLWNLKSVAELAPGVASKAMDRLPETPKRNAPWPS
ncbi:MAG TPA: FRG domain-containing protein [Candidatus Acidoferrales bacterium]|nr:FRG domain-containing protein [Candidatus Acidoferrales bacterium]